MSIFENLWTCNCDRKDTNDEDKITDVKLEVNKTSVGCDMLKNATSNDVKTLDVKFDMKFAMLNNKIDNMLLLLNAIKRET